jgi:hypothetical protein
MPDRSGVPPTTYLNFLQKRQDHGRDSTLGFYTYVPDFLCHGLAFLFRFTAQTLAAFAH